MKKQKNTPPSWAEIITEKERENAKDNEPKKYFYEDYTAEELLNLEAYYEEQKQLIKQENEL